MLAVPLTPHVMQAWKQMVDSSSGQLYYFNSATGETQWEEPAADYDPAEKTESGANDLFATLDTNGDGGIDRAEFEAAVSNKLDLKCSQHMLHARWEFPEHRHCAHQQILSRAEKHMQRVMPQRPSV